MVKYGHINHRDSQIFFKSARKLNLLKVKMCSSDISGLHSCCVTTGCVFKSRHRMPLNQAWPLAQT